MKKNILIFITVLVTTLLLVSGVEAAINISSNFLLSAGLPLDARNATTTTTARDNIPAVQRYDGLVTYSVADGKNYQLQGGITNSDWVEWTFGSGGVGTSTEPFMARNFVATSTSASSTLPNIEATQFKLASLNGFLKATSGYIATALIDITTDITGTLGITNGGTGTSTPASLGDVLVFNGSNYEGRATSTLGISGGAGSQTPWTSTIDGGGFALTNAGAITGTTLNATSTTATSTMAGGLAIEGNGFAYDYSIGTVGIGMDPVSGVKLALKSTAINTNTIRGVTAANSNILWSLEESNSGIGRLALNAANSNRISLNAGTNSYFNTGFNYGFGTTSPGTMIAIGTTTAGINISPFSTSTFGRGINLRGGCFSINDVCIGHDAVTLAGTPDYITIAGQVITRGLIDLVTDVTGILPLANGGTGVASFGANRLPYLNSSGTAFTSTSTAVFYQDKNLGLGTTTPANAIAIKRVNEDAAITLQVETTAGGVGGAAETATTSPGTAASGTGGSCIGSCAWANINNILSSNDVYATNADALARDDFTDYALATNYGFAIPAGSTINGIVVGVEANEVATDDFIDHSVRLIIGGVLSGTDKSAGASYSATDTFHTFGGPADLWGLTPTAAQINSSDFGVGVQLECQELSDCATGNMRLDTIQVKVYYTSTGGSTSDQTWTLGQESTDGKFKISFGHVLGSLTDYFTIASSTGQVSFPYFNATSTTASSTAANGINLTAGCFSIAGTCIGGGAGGTIDGTGIAGMMTAWLDSNTLIATSTIVGQTFIATSTTATSTLPLLTTTAISIAGEYISNFTNYVRALFSAGTGLTYAAGQFAVDLAANFTWLGSHDFGGATALEIPNGANPVLSVIGQIAHDNTSDNIVATSTTGYEYVAASATSSLLAFSLASTSPDFGSGGVIPYPADGLAKTALSVICKADAGTSFQMFLSDGTNDTNTVTCTNTSTQFNLTTNNSWTAYEDLFIEFGTVTGSVDYKVIRVMGYKSSN